MDTNYGYNSHSDLHLSIYLFGNPEKLTTHKEIKTENIYYILYHLGVSIFEIP